MRLPAKLDFTLPCKVREVAERIEAAGAELWVVGGAVRDHVLGRVVRDWDLATTMRPLDMQQLFPEAADVQLRYGRVSLSNVSGEIVITTLREDGEYLDHRHPSSVCYVDRLESDAPRRDFTINAIYLRALTGELTDPCGGWRDLASRQLRVIGEPCERMREDPLRMLRAIKFAVGLGLELTPDCLQALRAEGGTLSLLSPARRYAELTAIFSGAGRGLALQLLQETDLLRHCLPEVAAEDQEHRDTAVRVLSALPCHEPALAWAAVLHSLTDLDQVEMALHRFAVPRLVRHAIVDLCRAYAQVELGEWPRGVDSAQAHRTFLRARLSALGKASSLPAIEASLDRAQAVANLVDGQDVLAMGVPAGPMLGELLAELTSSYAGQELPGRDAALARLQKLVSARIKAIPRQVDKERRDR